MIFLISMLCKFYFFLKPNWIFIPLIIFFKVLIILFISEINYFILLYFISNSHSLLFIMGFFYVFRLIFKKISAFLTNLEHIMCLSFHFILNRTIRKECHWIIIITQPFIMIFLLKKNKLFYFYWFVCYNWIQNLHFLTAIHAALFLRPC